MHDSNLSLSRGELCVALGLPQQLVDELIDSGRVLCHVQRGEVRVPLSEIEKFFREGLVRVYRTIAIHEVAAAAPVVEAEPKREEETPAAAFEPEPQPEPEPEAEPAPPPVVAMPVASPKEEEHDDRPDLRMAPRYVPRRQIDGIFGETKFTIVQLSKTGLRIRHTGALMPGDEAKLSFALLANARSVVVRARVVWTSLARSSGDSFSISGVKVIEHQDRLARAIDMLTVSHYLQPERRAARRRDADDEKYILEGVSDDEVAAVMNAMQKFADDPVEANRWYGRGRFALSDEDVRRSAPARPREREEVLGIWEYLERQVEIPKVAGILKWARRASA